MDSHLDPRERHSPDKPPIKLNPIQRALQENEDWDRDLVEHSQDLLCIHDLQGQLLSVNPAPARVLGYSVEELLKIPMRDMVPPEARAQFDAYLSEIARTGESSGLMAVMTRSGERRIWEYHNTLRTEGVASPIVRGMAHDITERKRVERLWREASELNRQVIAGVSEGVAVFDREHRCRAWNPFMEQVHGISAGEAIGKTHDELVTTRNGQDFAEVMERVLRGETVTLPDLLTNANGIQRWISCRKGPLRDAQGEIAGMIVTLHDITQRKRVEQALSESESRERAKSKELETVLDAVPSPVFIADNVECRQITANRAGYEQLRLPKDANVSKSAPLGEQPAFRVMQAGFEVPAEELPMQMAAATGNSIYGVPLTLVFEGGEERQTLFNAVPLLGEDGRPRGAVGASLDITERKLAEDAVRQREETQRLILDHLPVGIILFSLAEQKVFYHNPRFLQLFGYSMEQVATAEDWWKLAYPDPAYREQISKEWDRRIAEATRAQSEIDPMEVTIACQDGSRKHIRIMAKVIGDLHCITFLDLTESKLAEESLRRSDERLRITLNSSPVKLFNQDRALRYTWVYNLQEGWTEQDYLGKTDEEIFEADDAAHMTALKRRVLESGQGAREEITITAAGKTYYCDLTVEPLRDTAGAVVGVNCACGDVTYLHQVTEELRLAKERLTEEKLYLEQTIDTELGFGEIIGQSKALKVVMEQLSKVAASDSTVLLLGDTGTGKELLARALHTMSKRRDKSFIKMNCAAIPSGLLESELFGHERGAFTGAVGRKIGRLELADRGTLFLDEVGEIALDLQPKLLRVLQDQEFERLGSTQTLKVNFRLVAATNRDLLRSVNEKQFRSDLYYRLNVFPIRVPPLRERKEDIQQLVEYFLRKYAGQMNKSISSIPKKTMDALVRWDWPGNVRELENFIERSVILTFGSVLQAPMSELEIPVAPANGGILRIDENEREKELNKVLQALKLGRGRLSGPNGAAARLGLNRAALQSKLKRLGINPERYRQ